MVIVRGKGVIKKKKGLKKREGKKKVGKKEKGKKKDSKPFLGILTIIVLSLIIIGSVVMLLYDYGLYCPYLFSYVTVLLFIIVLIIFIIATIEKLRGHTSNIRIKEVVKEVVKQDPETGKLLKIIDNLLEKLPDKTKEDFVYSKNFKLYKNVLKKYKIK